MCGMSSCQVALRHPTLCICTTVTAVPLSLVTVLGLGCCHGPGTVVVIKATTTTRLLQLEIWD